METYKLNQLQITNTKEYDWDEYLAWLKTNRFKLQTCFNSEVCSVTKYSKYIGKDYLEVEERDYSRSEYASRNMLNLIKFSWGGSEEIFQYRQTEKMPQSVDYLQAALDWYEDLRAEMKNPQPYTTGNLDQDDLVDYVMDFYGGEDPTWDFFESNPITKSEVKRAVYYYRTVVCPTTWGNNGYSDSFDREIVRDILFIQKGMVTDMKEQLEYGGFMSRFFTPKGKLKKKYVPLVQEFEMKNFDCFPF